MVFSEEDRILIKELPESGIWGKLHDGVYATGFVTRIS